MYPLTFTVHEYCVQCSPFENYLKHVENFPQNFHLDSSFTFSFLFCTCCIFSRDERANYVNFIYLKIYIEIQLNSLFCYN